MQRRYEQPELTDHWGVRFNGRAKTATGETWWYEQRNDNGTITRYPLLPAHVRVDEQIATKGG